MHMEKLLIFTLFMNYTVQNRLFEAVKITKNANTPHYKYEFVFIVNVLLVLVIE